jgi:hypothetical protein
LTKRVMFSAVSQFEHQSVRTSLPITTASGNL